MTQERRCKRCARSSGRRAFNLLEMLVVMLLIGIFAAVTYTSLDRTLPRIKLRGKATELSGFMQKARLEAIKAGRDVSIEVKEVAADKVWFVAYRVAADGVTKTEIGNLYIGAYSQRYDTFWGGDPSGTGDASLPSTFPLPKLVYKSTGVAQDPGAFRISIGKPPHQNTMEVAILSLGGQPVIRKFIKTADRPPTAAVQQYFAETHYGTKWQWTWY